MKILLFEVTIPKRFQSHTFHGAGWQDALENIIILNNDIELGVAFECSNKKVKHTIIDGIHYFPIQPKYTLIEKIKNKWDWSISKKKILPLSLEIINTFKPDVIQIFGSEWCFGQVTKYTNIPVVVHMQGSIPPYNNAYYPPGYNKWTELWFHFITLRWHKLLLLPLKWHKQKTWQLQEEETLRSVTHFMGRTHWDKAIVELYNPTAKYYYCSEALRPEFIHETRTWQPHNRKKIRLITTGCSTFWKGSDTIIRTAKLLKERNVDFEWLLAGSIGNKELLEWKENVKMTNVNIRSIGMLSAVELIEELLRSDLYIHTAYIDNSPNSICEAQILGMPIISTNVGGIASLITDGEDGILVPANDPYILSYTIMQVSNNISQQIYLSNKAKNIAQKRHNISTIKDTIYTIYNDLILSKNIT